jgi:hypothetical protein
MFQFLKRLFFHAWTPEPPPHMWKAYRFQGGGIITSPYEMTEDQACMWVANVIKGEVAYIDREMGFIFYRPKE